MHRRTRVRSVGNDSQREFHDHDLDAHPFADAVDAASSGDDVAEHVTVRPAAVAEKKDSKPQIRNLLLQCHDRSEEAPSQQPSATSWTPARDVNHDVRTCTKRQPQPGDVYETSTRTWRCIRNVRLLRGQAPLQAGPELGIAAVHTVGSDPQQVFENRPCPPRPFPGGVSCLADCVLAPLTTPRREEHVRVRPAGVAGRAGPT